MLMALTRLVSFATPKGISVREPLESHSLLPLAGGYTV